MVMKKYIWDFDGKAEDWQNDVFDTVEECLADARYHARECGDTPEFVYIGEITFFAPKVDATDVLDELEDQAYNFWPGCEWFTYGMENKDRKKETDELSEILTAAVNGWLKKYKREPNFYRVDNIKEYKMDNKE